MSGAAKTTRCTICRSEFTDAEIEGASACPVCNRTSVPERIADDVTVKVNWHELRILGMWAENWAMRNDDAEMARTVRIITSLLHQQYPEKPPLTMSEEMRDLRDAVHKMGGTMELSDPRLAMEASGEPPPQQGGQA